MPVAIVLEPRDHVRNKVVNVGRGGDQSAQCMPEELVGEEGHYVQD